MVDTGHVKLSVVRQCFLLKIARSGLYYEKAGGSPLNLALMQEIDRAFTEWPFLGVRQMRHYLASLGYGVGKQRAPPGAYKVSISAANPDHRQAQSGLVRGHYVYPDAQRLSVSGGRTGLA